MPTSRTALPLSSQACGGGHLTVERMLSEVAGVVTVSVNPVSEMADAEYDPTLTDPDVLFAVLRAPDSRRRIVRLCAGSGRR